MKRVCNIIIKCICYFLFFQILYSGLFYLIEGLLNINEHSLDYGMSVNSVIFTDYAFLFFLFTVLLIFIFIFAYTKINKLEYLLIVLFLEIFFIVSWYYTKQDGYGFMKFMHTCFWLIR